MHLLVTAVKCDISDMMAADGMLRRTASIFLPNEHSLFFCLFAVQGRYRDMLGKMMAVAVELNAMLLLFSYFS